MVEEDWVWYSHVWVKYLISKVAFLSYVAVKNKILTMDNLKNRGFKMPNRCMLCKCSEKMVDHILVSYEYTKQVFEYLFSLFQIQWVGAHTLKDFYL